MIYPLDMRLQERSGSEGSSSTQWSSSDHRVVGPSRGIRGLCSLRRVELRNTSGNRDRVVEDVLAGNRRGEDGRGRLAIEGHRLGIGAHSRLGRMGERTMDVLVDGDCGTIDRDGERFRVAESCGAGEEGVRFVDAAVACGRPAHAFDFVGGVIRVDADNAATKALSHGEGDTARGVVGAAFEDADDSGALGRGQGREHWHEEGELHFEWVDRERSSDQ